MDSRQPHRVRVVAFDGVVPFDLSVPLEVFGRVPGGAYDVVVCGVRPAVQAGAVRLSGLAPLARVDEADTVIVPGVDDVDRVLPPRLLEALRRVWDRGARVASVCSGAFVLAAAGLLAGRRATTHWAAAALLAQRYPSITVDPTPLYVDEGRILTSAGAAAGIDLCLHLVRSDLGATVAAEVARLSVVPLVREGGQAQFVAGPAAPLVPGPITPVLRWIEDHLAEPLEVPAVARRFAMSSRTFLRRFSEETGTTPARWIAAARVRRAQVLLEGSRLSVEEVAAAVGFGSPVTLRQRFTERVGVPPQAYRQAFRGE